jgi:sugar phosphate permease
MPIIIAALNTNFEWRKAFFITGVSSLVLATLGFFYIKEAKE